MDRSAFLRRTHSVVYVTPEDTMHNLSSERLVVVMCGLPARGKSYVSKKLCRYLSWNGLSVKTFNVGDYRRQQLTGGGQDHTFFDHTSTSNNTIRNQLAMDVLEELIDWLKAGGNVAIHDATNTTRSRRAMVLERLHKETNINVIFVESVCTDNSILESNIRLKLNSPDYVGKDPEEALADFRARLKGYEQVYEPLDEKIDDEIPFLKLIDVGKRVLANRIHGYLPSQIMFYLANYHVQPRTIWLCRHGESTDNTVGKLGGDAPLTPNGVKFAHNLKEFMVSQNLKGLKVWSSSLSRAIETAEPLVDFHRSPLNTGTVASVNKLRQLNEIYAGAFEGMTYKEIADAKPGEFAAREKDKLRYRYPHGGESYVDMIQRLQSIIIELERETAPVLIIAHTAVLRTIMSYFLDVKIEDLPFVNVPLHEVFCLAPTPYGCDQKNFVLGPTVVDNTKI